MGNPSTQPWELLVSANKIMNSYMFLYVVRQEVVLLPPLHIFILPHVTTDYRENEEEKIDSVF